MRGAFWSAAADGLLLALAADGLSGSEIARRLTTALGRPVTRSAALGRQSRLRAQAARAHGPPASPASPGEGRDGREGVSGAARPVAPARNSGASARRTLSAAPLSAARNYGAAGNSGSDGLSGSDGPYAPWADEVAAILGHARAFVVPAHQMAARGRCAAVVGEVSASALAAEDGGWSRCGAPITSGDSGDSGGPGRRVCARCAGRESRRRRGERASGA